jgi:hypothetical protein
MNSAPFPGHPASAQGSRFSVIRAARRFGRALFFACAALAPALVTAQETVCARVKIEIKQELTLERQAFDAEMRINNTTDTSVLENVSIVVKVTDEAGTPVSITDNPNDLSAKFFVQLTNRQNIAAIDGTGTVNPQTSAVINWMLVPAPGAANNNPLGKKYLVGATLKYRNLGVDTVVDLTPDVITVKPLPLLTLDYFLTQHVWADDPLTPAIEPVEPFTLGVRVKNTGFAAAKAVKIDSAQPKIIENNQGLLINFMLTGSYVNDAPVQNTLLLNFGDIAAASSKTGRWNMQTTLAGTFTEFSASFTHSDELGGALTSIMQATNAHLLIHDVRVDLPGRDAVRDFLAQDGDVIRVYESDTGDTPVTDRSAAASMTATSGGGATASYRLSFPRTDGFIYVRKPDPFGGTKALGKIVRSDAKVMALENVWLSKTRNEQTKQWEYWVNFFDINSTGSYDTEFQAPPAAARAPVIQFIPDRATKEQQQVSFIVEASSPDGKPVTLTASPLPAGASFAMQAADPQAPGLSRGAFSWTPGTGTAGSYLVTYLASDGALTATRSATIRVDSATPPPGPATPTIASPLGGAQVAALKPTLSVQTSTHPDDPTTQVQFEVYADAAMTQLLGTGTADKVGGAGSGAPTAWQVPTNLQDNTRYWWRARAANGSVFSPWANAWFFVNLFNDAPDTFNLSNPVPNAEVSSLTPTLTWTNSADKDGDALSYRIQVYKNTALTDLVVEAAGIAGDASGSTSWLVPVALENHVTYYWRVTASDALGAQTPSSARSFLIDTGNAAPSAPTVMAPAPGGQSTSVNTSLTVQDSVDTDRDLITLVFEIDTVNTFDSGNKRSSGPVIQNGSGTTSWVASGLVENKRYWWRVKAQDGRAESAWVIADFLMNAVNDAPAVPTVRNPGNGSWISSLQPGLEVNAAVDPEGEALRYEFEVYRDAALTQRVAAGSSTTTSWIVSPTLQDKATHYWRARAVDAQDAASTWAAPAVLYVSSGTYQPPSIAVTGPATTMVPETVPTPGGNVKRATITWEGNDPNIEPTVALYYSTSPAGFSGNLIVDGLRQTSGTHSGSYVWDVTSLQPGAYHVYAVIYDTQGVAQAYAPGAVVVPAQPQNGSIVLSKTSVSTTEAGGTGQFKLRLGSAPTAPVSIGLSSTNQREGTLSPTQLTFTPDNWSTQRTVTVTGQDDCAVDGTAAYQIVFSSANSLDPQFAGLKADTVSATNSDDTDRAGTTNNPNIHICRYYLVSETSINASTWEYVFAVGLTNTGPPVSSVKATAGGTPPKPTTTVDPVINVGAVGTGETVRSVDTMTLRTSSRLTDPEAALRSYTTWTVTATTQ